MAEMGVALGEDGHSVGLLQPKKVTRILDIIQIYIIIQDEKIRFSKWSYVLFINIKMEREKSCYPSLYLYNYSFLPRILIS